MTEDKRPKVGVGVIICKGDEVLLGLRIGNHGKGTWSFPGGHLEFRESLEQCAEREVKEEVGIEIKNLKPVAFTNDVFFDKHYITIFMQCDYSEGSVQNLEPDKCKEWKWFKWNGFPAPLFLPIENLLKQGFNPFKC